MQVRRAFFTPLLPHICANDDCMPMTADGTDARAFGPKLASPQTRCDGRDAVADLAGRETFDDLANLSRAGTRHRLPQKVDVIFVGAHLSKDDCIPLGDVSAEVSAYGVDFRVKEHPAILRWTHDMVKQRRDMVPFMPRVAPPSDHTTAAKAEASCEESDPRD